MARQPILAGGAGDNAAGAVGLSAVHPGDAFVSLGTSGVLLATTDCFRPYPQAAVRAFCHALPGTWHQMGVTLSAAASLAWWASITGRSEAELLAEIVMPDTPSPASFLPYLGGERTPLNDSTIRGAFAGLCTKPTGAFSHRRCWKGGLLVTRMLRCTQDFGHAHRGADVIGGGSRSHIWTAMIAAALNVPLHRTASGEHGAACGAVRLARMAVTEEAPEEVCTPPAPEETILPDPVLAEAYAARIALYRALTIKVLRDGELWRAA